jgi:ADP-ribosylglycohydrolase
VRHPTGVSDRDRDRLADRIRGCLTFAALGDAAGAPIEGCSRAEAAAYGDPLREWRSLARARKAADAPAEGFEGGGGGYAWTDDTGQLDALARALVRAGGELTEEAWRAALLEWFRTSPSAERAGPTTRAMLEGRTAPGDPRVGLTNGSAMRAAPAGLVHPGDPERAVGLAWIASRPTHDTQVGAAAAGAIAAGVAVALRGAGPGLVAETCVLGAALGHGLGLRHGRAVMAPRLSDRIELAVDEARAARGLGEALDRIEAAVGTSVLAFESVPAAVGVVVATEGDPLAAVRAGVAIGGDTDTIASMAGALAGAATGLAALEPDDRDLAEPFVPEEELVEGLADLAQNPPPGHGAPA